MGSYGNSCPAHLELPLSLARETRDHVTNCLGSIPHVANHRRCGHASLPGLSFLIYIQSPPGKNVLLGRLALPYIVPALHALAKLCGQKCRSFIRILGIREACVLVQFACAAKAGRQASTDHDYKSAAFNTPPVYEGPVTATTHGNEIAPSTWLEFSSSLMDALTRLVLFDGDVAKLFFGVIAVSRCI